MNNIKVGNWHLLKGAETLITFESLETYYDERYNKPKNDHEALVVLWTVYKKEMKHFDATIKDGIAETYREMKSKGIPAFYWFLEAIHRTSKKKQIKHSYSYIVGMLRNWVLYGFGNTMTSEEEEVFTFFAEMADVEMSNDARHAVSALMGKYGSFKLMRVMHQLAAVDKGVLMADMLNRMMIERFGGVAPALPPSPSDFVSPAIEEVSSSSEVVSYKDEESQNEAIKEKKKYHISTPAELKKKLNATIKFLKDKKKQQVLVKSVKC